MTTPSLAIQLITKFYGDDRAERTGVPYINHIHEGISILEDLGASEEVQDAYALHPIFQMLDNPEVHPLLQGLGDYLESYSVFLAREYKKTANAYLCKPHYRSPDDKITLSEYPDVNLMLIADKIQNRKDFETHYENQENKDVFSRADNLAQYFRNWLRALNVTEEEYQHYKAKLLQASS